MKIIIKNDFYLIKFYITNIKMIIPEEFLERARTSWKVPSLSAVLLTETTLRKRRNNIVKIQSYIRRYLIKKEFKRISQSAILIQSYIR